MSSIKDIQNYKKLPSTNGVYFLRQKGKPVYIGKSVNIKARLKSHFENAKLDAKEAAIIESCDSIDFIVTDSEFKALILESKLIQEYKPKYNVRWRDDKSYIYIKATIKNRYPKFSITRREDDKNARYFGPFPSSRIVREVLKEIRKVFPFCMQRKVGKTPCFYSKIGLCQPCPSAIEKLEDEKAKKAKRSVYMKNFRWALRVLDGKTDLVIKSLQTQIKKLKEQEKFEQAILVRDRLFKLKNVSGRRSFDQENIGEFNKSEKRIESLKNLLSRYFQVSKLSRIECFDMSTLSMKDSTASMVVFIDGLSDRTEYKRFKIKNQKAESDFEMLEEVMTRRMKRSDWNVPDLIVIDGGKPQIRITLKVMAEKNLEIPVIGIAKNPDRLIIGDESLQTIRPPLQYPGFQLIQAMRDEAHRFAKKYHTHIRDKNLLL